jgi:hypothetical protein
MLVDLLGLAVLVQQAAKNTLASHPENLGATRHGASTNALQKTLTLVGIRASLEPRRLPRPE